MKKVILLLAVTVLTGCFFGCEKEKPEPKEEEKTTVTEALLEDVPTESVYDEKNRPLTVVSKDADGIVLSYTNYSYSGDLLTRRDTFDGYGVMTSYRLFEYNEKGLCIKEEEYDPSDKLISYTTHEYNRRGSVRRIYAPDGTLKSTLEDYSEETG